MPNDDIDANRTRRKDCHLKSKEVVYDKIKNGNAPCFDKQSREGKQSMTADGDKILSESKQTKCQPSADPNSQNSDDCRLYENWSPRLPSLENICQKYDRSGDSIPLSHGDAHNLNHDALLLKMKQKMKDLIEEQFHVDYKIVMNNMQGAEIESKFSYFASNTDLQKFRNFVEEFDSVSCLIR